MAAARSAAARSGHWMWVAVAAIGTLYVSSTALTPLYPLYQRDFGIDELTVTEIYAIYAVGNLAVLFLFGRLSDQLGRRLTTLIALGVLLASMLLYLCASATGWLFAGRILNGFAAGLGAGAVTAWIQELEPRHDEARAAVVAASGNLAGLALGAAMAGGFAEHGPWPLQSPFAIVGALVIGMAALCAWAPETVRHPVRQIGRLSLRPRIGVPKGIRAAFVSPAAMAFASFALGGFYGALLPGLITRTLEEPSLVLVGGVVAAFFGTAALVAASTRALSARAAMLAAGVFMLGGLALLLGAEALRSLALLVIAALCGGAGMALGYRGSLQVLNELAPGAQRAEVLSSYLLVCYTGNSLPVLGVGALAAASTPVFAHRVFAAVIAVLACIGSGLAIRPVKGKG